jgi:hypothetical protein
MTAVAAMASAVPIATTVDRTVRRRAPLPEETATR